MLIALTVIAATCLPVTTIEVPAEAPSRRVIEYEEVWRTTPESDEYLIHQVGRVCTDDAGNVYVYESKVGEVLKFDAHGSFVGSVVQSGRPGWRPHLFMAIWEPDTIVHWTVTADRIFRTTTGGVELDDLTVFPDAKPHEFANLHRLEPAGEYAVISARSNVYGGETVTTETWVGVIDRDGNLIRKLGSRSESREHRPGYYEAQLIHELDELEHVWAWQEWATSRSGFIYSVPDRDTWRIERRTLDGTVDLVLRRDIELHVRTKQDVAELDERYGRYARSTGREFEAEWAATDPAVHGLEVRGEQLWVRSSMRGADPPEGHHGRYEVFSLDGEFIEQVDLMLEVAEGQDRFIALDDGRVMVIEHGITVWEERLARRTGEALEGEPTKPVIVMYREKR